MGSQKRGEPCCDLDLTTSLTISSHNQSPPGIARFREKERDHSYGLHDSEFTSHAFRTPEHAPLIRGLWHLWGLFYQILGFFVFDFGSHSRNLCAAWLSRPEAPPRAWILMIFFLRTSPQSRVPTFPEARRDLPGVGRRGAVW